MTPSVEGVATWRPAPQTIPVAPGVYRFRDENQRVIYVGKAKQLRQRLSSYFQDPQGLHPRTKSMIEAARSVDWTIVGTEVEALQLEYTWIKEHDPRFNVRYRDDKSYPYLAVTMADEVPRVMVMRGKGRPGARLFGPYSHAWAIRDTVDQLVRVFPMRSCSDGVFRRAQRSGRPCLLADIGRCAAPCVERVSIEEHRALAEDLCRFLAGDAGRFIRSTELAMKQAAAVQDYERAARLRDDVRALERALEKNTVVLPEDVDADVIGLHQDELEAAVQVFFVRAGRIRGRRGWITEKVEDLDAAGVVTHFLQELYGGAGPDQVPREVLVPVIPDDAQAMKAWLAERRGSRVDLRVPRRGDKRALAETVERNAAEAFIQHRLKRSADLSVRGQALEEIQDALELAQAPLRIECVDVSHLQGTDVVASLVVFEDGVPRRSDYRRFAIRSFEGSDDLRAVREVVERRFRRGAQPVDPEASDAVNDETATVEPSGQEPQAPTRRAFAYPPQLLVIDGGPAQAAAARAVLDELGIDDVAVVGLAKRLEEVWPAGAADPVILARGSQGLYLLQRIRDEAHRFALSFHRKRRSTSATTSALDAIPGLGPQRRKALVSHFGSVAKLRRASVEEIQQVPGIGPTLATTVQQALQASGTPRAINTATGEVTGP